MRVHILLKREGWQLGRSQAYRLYSEEQLQLRSKLPKRRKMVVQRRQRIEPRRAGDAWTMDFVADEFAGLRDTVRPGTSSSTTAASSRDA